MKERIIRIMEHEGLTSSKFAELIGIQRSAVSHILSGRNNASLDVLMKILECFNYINTDWLLFGRGEMMKSDARRGTPDLFSNTPLNRPEGRTDTEYRKDLGVQRIEIAPKQAVIEQVAYKERPSKNISKIMIFYSDNTYETFTPEKNKKE
ncbi:helix-turn-helix transcriptional regulator [Parabacteroides sp. Marseille-P3160]|uniref:helix-turn-helix domain-containing protein n=1 Tax=Parabacteroides sp. Marseille-P3160 TaxID=1917887 RepID=UPI0009BA00BF|nr:helix-turn-helix transcriptional regulator [Parabacteroides sp. Marseille-P3160]